MNLAFCGHCPKFLILDTYIIFSRMEFKKHTVQLHLRRYDLSANPSIQQKTIEVSPFIDHNTLKNELKRICNITNDEKVIKIRSMDGILVPISFLTDIHNRSFYLDIANVSYVDKNTTNLLQDAYVDAVQYKIQSLESRIAQSELLLPQLEWRKQAYMEDTVSGLCNKVAFLNRRFDELLPQYKANIQTMS